MQIAATLLALCLTSSSTIAPARQPAQGPATRPVIERFLAQWEELEEPAGLALADDGELFICELNQGRLVRISSAGKSVVAEGLRGPRDVELGRVEAGALTYWVAESRGKCVVKLHSDGTRTLELKSPELERPHGLAVAGERVYVADAGSHHIEVFSRAGEHLFGFGGHGTRPGSLIEPRDVAVGEDGHIYVADYGNSRVEVFDSKGQRIGGWGDWGPYPGLFMGPSGIEVRGARVYVSDERNHRVQVFTTGGEALGQFGLHAIRPREGRGKLHYPSALALSPNAELAAVCEPLLDRAQVFARSAGTPEDAVRKRATQLTRPSSHFGTELSISGPYLAISEPESHQVLIYENTGAEPRGITRVSALGKQTGLLTSVAGVDLMRSDRSLLACDPALRRLSLFRMSGSEEDEVAYDILMARFIKCYDFELGFGLGAFKGSEAVPEPIAVDRDAAGRIYVLDRRNRKLIVMNSDFEPLADPRCSFHFSEPVSLAVDPSGARLAVTDVGRGLLFLLEGGELRTIGEQAGLLAPHGVAIDDEGQLYVTDSARHEVLVFDQEGELLRRWGQPGLGRGELLEPRGIELDTKGRVVVMDHANHRVQLFSKQGEYLGIFGSRLYTKPARYPETKQDED